MNHFLALSTVCKKPKNESVNAVIDYLKSQQNMMKVIALVCKVTKTLKVIALVCKVTKTLTYLY
jgi:hypothetical protein